MGILDLFRPKWKNSDPAVRAEAVRALFDEDVATLRKVAIRDTDSAVQRLAVKRLVDPVVLQEVATALDGTAIGNVARKKAEELFLVDALADVPLTWRRGRLPRSQGGGR